MRKSGTPAALIAATAFRDMYWTFAQMLTHHASNGSNLRTGDLLASGTASGVGDAARACLAELTSRGTEPLRLANDEMRAWLEDGDEIVLRGRTARSDAPRIGFGECRGRIAPALALRQP